MRVRGGRAGWCTKWEGGLEWVDPEATKSRLTSARIEREVLKLLNKGLSLGPVAERPQNLCDPRREG